MTLIHTVVITLPRIVSDIVEQLPTDGIRLAICARLDTRERIEDTLCAILPDLVLVGLGPDEFETIGVTLSAIVPLATVIAFTSDARAAHVVARGIPRGPINLTVDAIVSVIRGIQPVDADPSQI